MKEGGGGRRADGKMEGVDVAKTKMQTLLTYIISNTRSLDISPQNGEITLERETR